MLLSRAGCGKVFLEKYGFWAGFASGKEDDYKPAPAERWYRAAARRAGVLESD